MIKFNKTIDNPSDSVSKLYNPAGVYVSYSTRHVEESWHHLMKSEDTQKFKQIAVCNFDFLLASVSNVTASIFFYSSSDFFFGLWRVVEVFFLLFVYKSIDEKQHGVHKFISLFAFE